MEYNKENPRNHGMILFLLPTEKRNMVNNKEYLLVYGNDNDIKGLWKDAGEVSGQFDEEDISIRPDYYSKEEIKTKLIELKGINKGREGYSDRIDKILEKIESDVIETDEDEFD